MVYVRERAVEVVVSGAAWVLLYVVFFVWPEFFISERGGVTFVGALVAIAVGVANLVTGARFVLGIGDALDTSNAYLARIDARLTAERPFTPPPSTGEAPQVVRAARGRPKGPIGWPD